MQEVCPVQGHHGCSDQLLVQGREEARIPFHGAVLARDSPPRLACMELRRLAVVIHSACVGADHQRSQGAGIIGSKATNDYAHRQWRLGAAMEYRSHWVRRTICRAHRLIMHFGSGSGFA